MSFFGGDLSKHDSFKNILSIGYEFETNDLAKLSLSDNELVNSGINSSNMSIKIDNTSATKIDDNNYEIIDEESGLYYIDYYDEYDGVANDHIFMNITNDIGKSNFYTLLIRHCEKYQDENVSKNDMYVFKTEDGQEYKITFDDHILSLYCSTLSNVEYLVTYLKIKRSNNIILETFLNACHRIFTHLHDVKKIPGDLFIKDIHTGKDTKIGHLKKRILYHKPNTNLYYLQTHDNEYFYKDYSIGMTAFVPQMTFRANIKHVVSIIKDILHNTDVNKNTRTKKTLKNEYNQVLDIEKCLEELFESYNKTATKNKKISRAMKNNIFGYFFMIFYKIYMYVNGYNTTNTSEEGNYFKDYISFYARHTNIMFYNKIKEIMLPVFGENTVSIIIDLLNQPSILANYIYTTRSLKKALKVNLELGDEYYGDPSVSFISYFKHFEVFPEDDTEQIKDTEKIRDWFMSADIDVYSNHFKMPDDGSIIIENRLFLMELTAYANELDVHTSGSFTLNNLKNLYRKLITIGKEVEDISKKELNVNTMRFVNKCKKGQYRDENFVCKTKAKKRRFNKKTTQKIRKN